MIDLASFLINRKRLGFNTGENLILTFEAEGCPFNIKEIREMIKEIFRH